jgi:hypothetical protein
MEVRTRRSLALGVLIAGGLVTGTWACGSATGLDLDDSGISTGSPDGDHPDASTDGPSRDDVVTHPPDGPGQPDVFPPPFDGPNDVFPPPFDVFPPPFDAPFDVFPPPFDVFPPPFDVFPPPFDSPFDVFPPPFDAPFDVGPPDSAPPWDGGVPITIATDEQPANLAVDGNYIYWENSSGSALDCPLTGCPSNTPTILSIGDVGYASFGTLAVGGGSAFFVDALDNIADCSGAGCGNSPTSFSSSPTESYQSLVNDAANLYFTDTTSIYSCPLGGTCAFPNTLATAPSAYLGPLAVSSTEVYFVDDGPVTQSIRAVPIAGGKERKVCVSSVLEDVVAMVVTPAYVYFTTYDDPSSIYQCSTAGGSPPSVYMSDTDPYGLATDGASLYWTNNVGLGSVATCPIGAFCSNPKSVAIDQDTPLAVAVDATHVYWSTTSAIYRANKP